MSVGGKSLEDYFGTQTIPEEATEEYADNNETVIERYYFRTFLNFTLLLA